LSTRSVVLLTSEAPIARIGHGEKDPVCPDQPRIRSVAEILSALDSERLPQRSRAVLDGATEGAERESHPENPCRFALQRFRPI
jgi:hypothetical protein